MILQETKVEILWTVIQWGFTIISTIVASVAMFILRNLMTSRDIHAQKIQEGATNVAWLMKQMDRQHEENLGRFTEVLRRLDQRSQPRGGGYGTRRE